MEKITYKKDGVLFGDTFVKLTDIIENINKIKTKEDNLVKLSISWPEGRGNDGINETLVVSRENALRIREILVGKTIYFGEIHGKHSEVYGTIDEDEITICEDNDKVIAYLQNNSSHEYNHSFIDKFLDYAFDGGYSDVDDDLANELQTLVYG